LKAFGMCESNAEEFVDLLVEFGAEKRSAVI